MKTDIMKLVEKCQKGDNVAFSKLYEHFFQAIYNYIYYRTWHRETAEDLVSLTFTKAYDKINTYSQRKGAFSSWIYRIAHNSIIDHFRRSKAEKPLDDIWELPDDRLSDLDEENIFRWERVKHLLQDLPARSREIIVMRIWDELSYKEIAKVVGKTESACKMTYSRAIKLLQQRMNLSLVLFILFSAHSWFREHHHGK